MNIEEDRGILHHQSKSYNMRSNGKLRISADICRPSDVQTTEREASYFSGYLSAVQYTDGPSCSENDYILQFCKSIKLWAACVCTLQAIRNGWNATRDGCNSFYAEVLTPIGVFITALLGRGWTLNNSSLLQCPMTDWAMTTQKLLAEERCQRKRRGHSSAAYKISVGVLYVLREVRRLMSDN